MIITVQRVGKSSASENSCCRFLMIAEEEEMFDSASRLGYPERNRKRRGR